MSDLKNPVTGSSKDNKERRWRLLFGTWEVFRFHIKSCRATPFDDASEGGRGCGVETTERNATDDLALHSNGRRRHIWPGGRLPGRTDGCLAVIGSLSSSLLPAPLILLSLCHVTCPSPWQRQFLLLPRLQTRKPSTDFLNGGWMKFVAASVRQSIDFPDQYCRRTSGCHWRMRNVRCPRRRLPSLSLPSPPGVAWQGETDIGRGRE